MGLTNFILECEKDNEQLRNDINYYKNFNKRLQKENQKLKKKIEEYKEQVSKGLYNTCLPYTTGYDKAIKDKEMQQKEFIEYLENEININPYDISDYDYEYIINTILSKYKKIIGED